MCRGITLLIGSILDGMSLKVRFGRASVLAKFMGGGGCVGGGGLAS